MLINLWPFEGAKISSSGVKEWRHTWQAGLQNWNGGFTAFQKTDCAFFTPNFTIHQPKVKIYEFQCIFTVKAPTTKATPRLTYTLK